MDIHQTFSGFIRGDDIDPATERIDDPGEGIIDRKGIGDPEKRLTDCVRFG
ncbi:MAG: hypothetical protein IPJ06_05635 [Saprospiraceae bacterium]|nr:hypothetical protein [Saprospiraceae bacterium]